MSNLRKSFGELLADMARFNANGIAITCGNANVTWKGLNGRVNSLANALKNLGVKKNDHAALLLHDCAEFIEANYALQKLGAVPIPVNFHEADRRILLIDCGHYETEKFSGEILYELIIKKFPTFAVRFSKKNTNPINYL